MSLSVLPVTPVTVCSLQALCSPTLPLFSVTRSLLSPIIRLRYGRLKAQFQVCPASRYDEDAFDEKGIQKAGFKTMNPIEELGIGDRNIIVSPITTLTKESLKDSGLDLKSIVRCKNMFTLGMCFFMFNKELDHTFEYLEKKFKKKPALIDTNKKVLKDGFNYASNIHAIANTYYVQPAKQEKGTYRNINGNQATAWGLLAASEKSGVPLFCGSYPITPATAILEELAIHNAGICTAIGAAYAGNFAVTTTSGPGLSLKSEALGLAMITELPLVLVDVQRSGPSTGIPTKTEQTDLNQALYGRNGECPIMVMAAHSPSDCFEKAFYAGKFAMEHMMPVILLTEGFLGNGSEPYILPSSRTPPSAAASSAPSRETPRHLSADGQCPAPPVWSTA